MPAFRNLCLFAIVLCFLAVAFGCGGAEAVRGDDVAGLDNQAMSTGLDRRDLQKMLDENLRALQSSAAGRRWAEESRPAVSVIPMRNETSEHIDSALEALISDVETNLINWGVVRVISLENHHEVHPREADDPARRNARLPRPRAGYHHRARAQHESLHHGRFLDNPDFR